jgi:hypothetical protein
MDFGIIPKDDKLLIRFIHAMFDFSQELNNRIRVEIAISDVKMNKTSNRRDGSYDRASRFVMCNWLLEKLDMLIRQAPNFPQSFIS